MSLSVEACPSFERRTRTTGVDFTTETLPEPHFFRSRRAQAPAVAHSTMNRSLNPGRATLFPTPIAFRRRRRWDFWILPPPSWGWSLDVVAEYITTNGLSSQLYFKQALLSGPSFTQRNAQFEMRKRVFDITIMLKRQAKPQDFDPILTSRALLNLLIAHHSSAGNALPSVPGYTAYSAAR